MQPGCFWKIQIKAVKREDGLKLLPATAEYVTKVHAICMQCGNLAQYSFRKDTSDKIVLIGEKNVYEPLCRRCYYDIQSRGKTPGSK